MRKRLKKLKIKIANLYYNCNLYLNALECSIRRDLKRLKAKHLSLLLLPLLALSALSLPSKREYLQWKVEPSIIKITLIDNYSSGGTGFVVEAPNGKNVVLTNRHVCEVVGGRQAAGFIQGTFEPILLRVVKISDKTDICMLEGADSLPALSLASNPVRRGDSISVIGFPLFDPITYAEGYVISEMIVPIARALPETQECKPGEKSEKMDLLFYVVKVCTSYFKSYLTDTLIYGGNSGSPVLNSWGNVVGIVFAANSRSNKGLFIGLENLQEFLTE